MAIVMGKADAYDRIDPWMDAVGRALSKQVNDALNRADLIGIGQGVVARVENPVHAQMVMIRDPQALAIP